MTQNTVQTRNYIAPQGTKELCLTQFSHFSNETDRIFFLPTTSPFEWQSFLPKQPLSAPSDHNPAWLERRSHEIMISHVCLNSYSRTSKKLKSMSNATNLPPVFGLSGEWGCLIDGHWDREIGRTDRSAGLPLHWWIVYWQIYRRSNRNLGSVFLGCLAPRKEISAFRKLVLFFWLVKSRLWNPEFSSRIPEYG